MQAGRREGRGDMTAFRRIMNIGILAMVSLLVIRSAALAHGAGVRGTQALYVANEGSDTVSVMDVGSMKVTGAIAVGSGPQDVAISPDRRFAFVTCSRSADVWILALPAHTVVATVSNATGPGGQTVFGAGATYAYVTNSRYSRVTVIEAATGKKVAMIPVGEAPTKIGISPDGSHAYVPSERSNTVAMLNLSLNVVAAELPMAVRPYAAEISPDGKYLLVSSPESNSVTVFDAATQQSLRRIPVGNDPHYVLFGPGGAFAYILNRGSDSLSVIQMANLQVVATIPVGKEPSDADITPSGHYIYVTNMGSGDVSVISTATSTVV